MSITSYESRNLSAHLQALTRCANARRAQNASRPNYGARGGGRKYRFVARGRGGRGTCRPPPIATYSAVSADTSEEVLEVDNEEDGSVYDANGCFVGTFDLDPSKAEQSLQLSLPMLLSAVSKSAVKDVPVPASMPIVKHC